MPAACVGFIGLALARPCPADGGMSGALLFPFPIVNSIIDCDSSYRIIGSSSALVQLASRAYTNVDTVGEFAKVSQVIDFMTSADGLTW